MRLNRKILAAFAVPSLPLAAVGLPTVVYLPPYYSSELGLSLSAVGMIFLLVRLIDIPLDPFIGHAIDRTTTRFGRFRPWLAGGGLMVMAGAMATYMASPGISVAAAFAGVLVLYIGYSGITVAHTAWGATLTDDYHERSRVFGWWMVIAQLGMLIVLTLPPIFARLTPGGGSAPGIHAMGWMIIAGLPLTLIWMFAQVPERPRLKDHAPKLGDLVTVFRNPLMRKLLAVDLIANLAPGITGALFLFFFEAAKGYGAVEASLLLLVYFVFGMIGVPLWTAIARRTSKHRTIVLALFLYAITQAATFLLPPDNWPLAAVSMALAGLPYGATMFLLRAMLADVSDAETLRSGQEKTGLFYAAAVAVQKLGYAIPVGLTYPVLGYLGFEARLGTGNSASAIDGLTMLFVVPPVLLALIAAWVVSSWPLDAKAQAANAEALRS